MTTGTTSLYGIEIEWDADETEEDGFTWRVVSITAEDELTAVEIADIITDSHDEIDKLVRRQYVEEIEEHELDLDIGAYEDRCLNERIG